MPGANLIAYSEKNNIEQISKNGWRICAHECFRELPAKNELACSVKTQVEEDNTGTSAKETTTIDCPFCGNGGSSTTTSSSSASSSTKVTSRNNRNGNVGAKEPLSDEQKLIIGGSAGGALLLCAVGTVLMVLLRQRRRSGNAKNDDKSALPAAVNSGLQLSYYDTSTKNQAFSSGDWGSEWKQYYDETSKRWYSSNGIETQWLD